MSPAHRAYAKAVSDEETKFLYRCGQRAQDCKFQSKVGVCNHSTYDIPLEEMGDIMENHGNDILYGTMIYSPSIRDNDEGILDSFKMTFRKFERDGRTRIRFGFVGDPSDHYEHDFSNYMQYSRPRTFSRNRSCFYYEIMDQRADTIFF
jgi:hypothetical protein